MFNKKIAYYYVTYAYSKEDSGMGYGAICIESSITGFLARFGNVDLLIRDAKNVIERRFSDQGIKVEIVILDWKRIKKHQYLEFENLPKPDPFVLE